VSKVAGLHGKVRRQRLDLAHKTALDLVRDYDLVAVEDLRVRNMTRRAAPKPDPDRPGQFPPNGQAAKSGLNRSILDAGWGAFVNVLRAKAESAGRVIVEVDARHTSQRCAAWAVSRRRTVSCRPGSVASRAVTGIMRT
jgi:putative transposase